MTGDEDELSAKKRMTRQSLQLMGLSGRMKRMSTQMGSSGAMFKSSRALVGGLGELSEDKAARDDEAAIPATEDESGTPDDNDDALQMLKDSFRELTGHAMPEGMTLEEGYAELRLKTVSSWMARASSSRLSLMPEESSEKSTLSAAPRGKLQGGIRKVRTSLRVGSLIMQDPVDTEPLSELREEDWDTELIQMLADVCCPLSMPRPLDPLLRLSPALPLGSPRGLGIETRSRTAR